MIFFIVFALFFIVAAFTGYAIAREDWPRVVVAFGGMITGVFMIPVAFQLMVLFF